MPGIVTIRPPTLITLTATEKKMKADWAEAFLDTLQADVRLAINHTLTVLYEADLSRVDSDATVWVHAGVPLYVVMWITGAAVLPMRTQEDWRTMQRMVAEQKEAGRCPFSVLSNSAEFFWEAEDSECLGHTQNAQVVRSWLAAYTSHIQDMGGFMRYIPWGLMLCPVGIGDHIAHRMRSVTLYGCSPDSKNSCSSQDVRQRAPLSLCHRIWCVQVHAAAQGMVPKTPSERKSFSAAVLEAVNAALDMQDVAISWNALLRSEDAEFERVTDARDRLLGAIDGEYQCTVYPSAEALTAAGKRVEAQRTEGECPYRAFVRKAASKLDAYAVRLQALYRGNRARARHVCRHDLDKRQTELTDSVGKLRHASAVKLQSRTRGLLVRRRKVRTRCQDSGVPKGICVVVDKAQKIPSTALLAHLYDGNFELEARALPPSGCIPLLDDDNPFLLIPNFRPECDYGANDATKVLARQTFMQLLEKRGVAPGNPRDEGMSVHVVNHIKRSEARKCITAAAHAALGPHPKDSTREQAVAGVEAASKYALNVEKDLVDLSWAVSSVMADAQWFYTVAVHCIVNTLQKKVRRSDDDRSFAKALHVHAALALAYNGDDGEECTSNRRVSKTKPGNVFWVRVRTATDYLVAMLDNCHLDDATGRWTWKDVHVNVPLVAKAIFRVGGKGRDVRDDGTGRFDVRCSHEIVAIQHASTPGIDSQGGTAQPEVSVRFAYEQVFSHTFSLRDCSGASKPDGAAPSGRSPRVDADCTTNEEDFAYDEMWALVVAANRAGGTLSPGVLGDVARRVAKRHEFKRVYARRDKTRSALRADYEDMLRCLRTVQCIDAKLGIQCATLSEACATMTRAVQRKEMPFVKILFAMQGIFETFGVDTSGGGLNLEPLLAECAATAHRGKIDEASFVVETVVRMLRDPWHNASAGEREIFREVSMQAQALLFAKDDHKPSVAGNTETHTSASPAAPSASSPTVADTAPKSRKERKRELQMAAQSVREARERDKQREKNKRKQEKQARRACNAAAAPPTGATRHGPVRGSQEYQSQLQAWEEKVRKAREEDDRMRAAEDARRREFADLQRDCNGTFTPSAKFTAKLQVDTDSEDDEALQQAMVASLQMQALEQAQASAREAAEEQRNDPTGTLPSGGTSTSNALVGSGGAASVADCADCADCTDVEDVKQVEKVDEDTLMLCVVCMEQPKVMASTPCGHRCACPTCAKQCENCPICRASVAAWLRVYD